MYMCGVGTLENRQGQLSLSTLSDFFSFKNVNEIKFIYTLFFNAIIISHLLKSPSWYSCSGGLYMGKKNDERIFSVVLRFIMWLKKGLPPHLLELPLPIAIKDRTGLSS